MFKKYFYVFLLITIFNSIDINGQTQMEMNQTAHNDFLKAEKKLSKVYNKVMKILTVKEKILITKAQEHWLKYRDKNCEFEKEQYDGGSIQPLIYFTCLTMKTNERTDELQGILKDESR